MAAFGKYVLPMTVEMAADLDLQEEWDRMVNDDKYLFERSDRLLTESATLSVTAPSQSINPLPDTGWDDAEFDTPEAIGVTTLPTTPNKDIQEDTDRHTAAYEDILKPKLTAPARKPMRVTQLPPCPQSDSGNNQKAEAVCCHHQCSSPLQNENSKPPQAPHTAKIKIIRKTGNEKVSVTSSNS